MSFPRVRFTVQQWTLVIAVVGFTLTLPTWGLMLLGVVPAWWHLKPCLTLVLLPCSLFALTSRHSRGWLARHLIAVDLFFLSLWIVSDRPYPWEILLGQWEDNVFLVTLSRWSEGRVWLGETIRLYGTTSGGFGDLAFLVTAPCLVIAAGAIRLPRAVQPAIPLGLWLMRAYDWAASPRMRLQEGSHPLFPWKPMDLNATPAGIALGWSESIPDSPSSAARRANWESLATVEWLELAVLVGTLAFVVATVVEGGWCRSPRARSTESMPGGLRPRV